MKIEKKKQELERNQKRLRSLANVRPAFMDEYERLEEELSRQYQGYVERLCNLSYLENQLDEHLKAERDKMLVRTSRQATTISCRKLIVLMSLDSTSQVSHLLATSLNLAAPPPPPEQGAIFGPLFPSQAAPLRL